MTINTEKIRILPEDIKLLRCECKLVFLRDNPDYVDEKFDTLTDAFLLHRVIAYYLK
jgi:hypothetical protein